MGSVVAGRKENQKSGIATRAKRRAGGREREAERGEAKRRNDDTDGTTIGAAEPLLHR